MSFVLNIFVGFCAEFDQDGALIQDNYKADCRKYDPPCPKIYNSAEAYKCELYFSIKKKEMLIEVYPSHVPL